MADVDQIMEKLKEIVHEQFGFDMSVLDKNARLGDLGVDSLHVVDVMLDLESTFGFNFQTLDLPPNPSLGEIAVLVQKNQMSNV